MEIYFVRHGQTDGNVAKRHQAEHTALTPLGKQQAKEVAEILTEYRPTHLVTSTLVRAIQTAQVISEVCDLIPVTSGELVEIGRPKHLHGHYHRSLGSLYFYIKWYFGLTDDAQGESYRELRARVKRVQAEFGAYPDDARIVVVTHSVFMAMFIAHMCRDKALTPFQAYRTFRTILVMKNTHILPLLYDTTTDKNVCQWQLGL